MGSPVSRGVPSTTAKPTPFTPFAPETPVMRPWLCAVAAMERRIERVLKIPCMLDYI
jgi:hypothetical protein